MKHFRVLGTELYLELTALPGLIVKGSACMWLGCPVGSLRDLGIDGKLYRGEGTLRAPRESVLH